MKKKLLDRKGVAIELAILMTVVSISISVLLLSAAMLQHSHKTKVEEGMQQDIFLEQLGEEFMNAVQSGTMREDWLPAGFEGITVEHGATTDHTWVIGETVPATCEEDGYTEKTCSRCGVQDPIILPALGHSVTAFDLINPEAKCEMAGEGSGLCEQCGIRVTVVIPALGHNFVDGETLAADCVNMGYIFQSCDRCEATNTIEVPALGHSVTIDSVTTEAGCETEGLGSGLCEHCQQRINDVSIPALGHSWDEGVVTTEPSCTATGIKAYQCTVETCDGAKEEILDMLPHSYHGGLCACGEIEPAQYTLWVIKTGKGTYKLQIDVGELNAEAPVAPTAETEPPVDLEHCPVGGDVVLKIWVRAGGGTYTIMEWTKK